ncbi:ClC family H(+)/Cl(-) exchange transporter [Methylosinus sp. Sm6]|uniref:ClC family H(+)/Cl(-) exchange transporter n=1 Tax=Methylosinus sp. Sm6 TaxID=2866948 RepID=UPI001C9990F7|nr:ClC family H(+)/Cl(-) exchange transporter [Methylosinus sp. Sm6]MBY6240848.1 ClC family H(+)/Cl(-) exchange transporter [Methylosinus sp. Sm6]
MTGDQTDLLLTAFVVLGCIMLPLMLRLARSRRLRNARGVEMAEAADVLSLGGRRRLVLMRDPHAERLILIGGPNDIVVEPNIDHPAPAPIEPPPPPPSQLPGLPPLGLLSVGAGVMVGLLCGAFRLALESADRFRSTIPIALHDRPALGCALMIFGAAAAAWLAAFLVRRIVPSAVGSGIPHVESVLHRDEPPASLILLPVKFIGGVLAIGAGLALGREGPSVQMGATLAHQIGRLFRCEWRDAEALLASGAGAGLAAAFNAPLAGSAFVLEELLRRFDMRHATVALGASAGAIAVMRLMIGPTPELRVAPHFTADALDVPASLALGAAAGVVSLAYNRAILRALDLADDLPWRIERKAALVGAAVGALAFFAPGVVGGGETLTQRTLDGEFTLATLLILFALRFLLGVVSYAAGTPGGLFAPLLTLGAELGFFFGLVLHGAEAQEKGMAYAIIGMAAYFAAVVRAPLTGMILITEMTNSSELLLPMLAACFGAMTAAAACRNEPIYDALKARAARLARRAEE